MSILKCVNKKGKYHDWRAFKNVIGYIINPEKVRSEYIVVGALSSSKNAAKEMREVFGIYGKKSIRLYHMVLSFSEDETVTAKDAYKLAKNISTYFSDRYQFIAGVHEDADYIHIHFAWNAVSYIDGKKYRADKNAFHSVARHIERLLDKMDYKINISLKF